MLVRGEGGPVLLLILTTATLQVETQCPTLASCNGEWNNTRRATSSTTSRHLRRETYSPDIHCDLIHRGSSTRCFSHVRNAILETACALPWCVERSVRCDGVGVPAERHIFLREVLGPDWQWNALRQFVPSGLLDPYRA